MRQVSSTAAGASACRLYSSYRLSLPRLVSPQKAGTCAWKTRVTENNSSSCLPSRPRLGRDSHGTFRLSDAATILDRSAVCFSLFERGILGGFFVTRGHFGNPRGDDSTNLRRTEWLCCPRNDARETSASPQPSWSRPPRIFLKPKWVRKARLAPLSRNPQQS